MLVQCVMAAPFSLSAENVSFMFKECIILYFAKALRVFRPRLDFAL